MEARGRLKSGWGVSDDLFHTRLLTAYTLDFRADFAEFFLDVFVAAVEVVDAFDEGFATCN